ncbi:unnamed protein product [Sphagnum jensenii]|uniref:Chlororespiratory reduction 6 n=1 Tax=Sphagnum jensenii TaxID=128206 RepID=A0ABP0XFW9_9BRYO
MKIRKNPPTALAASVSCLYTPTQCQLQLCNPLRLYLVFNINKCQGRQRVARISSSLNPQGAMDFSMEEEEVGPDVTAAPPPTPGRIDILVTKDVITQLDLTPAHEVFRKYVEPPDDPQELFKRTVGFVLDYERDDPLDPRELSEYPDIRLWFVRLDAAYPWLPIVLDWRAGELSRYVAMLVPHQMSRQLGLVFNPEALELFAMNKLFLLYTWLNARKVPKPAVRINDMMRILGFGISEQLYSLLEESPHP